ITPNKKRYTHVYHPTIPQTSKLTIFPYTTLFRSNNTVRDLLDLDVSPADDFPADDVGYGFDNIGDVLSISPIHTEKYLDAAEKRSEEHTSELQSRENLVCRLLLVKIKINVIYSLR